MHNSKTLVSKVATTKVVKVSPAPSPKKKERKSEGDVDSNISSSSSDDEEGHLSFTAKAASNLKYISAKVIKVSSSSPPKSLRINVKPIHGKGRHFLRDLQQLKLATGQMLLMPVYRLQYLDTQASFAEDIFGPITGEWWYSHIIKNESPRYTVPTLALAAIGVLLLIVSLPLGPTYAELLAALSFLCMIPGWVMYVLSLNPPIVKELLRKFNTWFMLIELWLLVLSMGYAVGLNLRLFNAFNTGVNFTCMVFIDAFPKHRRSKRMEMSLLGFQLILYTYLYVLFSLDMMHTAAASDSGNPPSSIKSSKAEELLHAEDEVHWDLSFISVVFHYNELAQTSLLNMGSFLMRAWILSIISPETFHLLRSRIKYSLSQNASVRKVSAEASASPSSKPSLSVPESGGEQNSRSASHKAGDLNSQGKGTSSRKRDTAAEQDLKSIISESKKGRSQASRLKHSKSKSERAADDHGEKSHASNPPARPLSVEASRTAQPPALEPMKASTVAGARNQVHPTTSALAIIPTPPFPVPPRRTSRSSPPSSIGLFGLSIRSSARRLLTAALTYLKKLLQAAGRALGQGNSNKKNVTFKMQKKIRLPNYKRAIVPVFPLTILDANQIVGRLFCSEETCQAIWEKLHSTGVGLFGYLVCIGVFAFATIILPAIEELDWDRSTTETFFEVGSWLFFAFAIPSIVVSLFFANLTLLKELLRTLDAWFLLVQALAACVFLSQCMVNTRRYTFPISYFFWLVLFIFQDALNVSLRRSYLLLCILILASTATISYVLLHPHEEGGFVAARISSTRTSTSFEEGESLDGHLSVTSGATESGFDYPRQTLFRLLTLLQFLLRDIWNTMFFSDSFVLFQARLNYAGAKRWSNLKPTVGRT